MGFGVSIFLLTLGAIFKFAIKGQPIGDTVDLQVIGLILMLVGGATLLLQIVSVMRTGKEVPGGPERVYNGDNHPPQV